MTITTTSFLIGAALIFIAILGGGIEAKEVKIPVLNFWARIFSFIFGCTLIGIGLYQELGTPRRTFAGPPSTTTGMGAPSPSSLSPSPTTPSPSDNFGIALIASSTPQVAQKNAIKAKS